ncbi:transcriptional regulator [Actinoplanes philippinensis]|uniref:DNA-binding transcriptional regulator, ArsR family n=1 Tax=Actinoplanes philippinensis TaxID=35752 RepID=A0A1I2KDD8_9ACTN|nr:transcriptional regulator [Actinoplanes philippinensis]SFF64994.1 DNA-binding transcriptional regulator, ArsR family [Actinoplanes philippinensis]
MPDIADVTMIDLLRAVADPIRLRIVQTLADGLRHGKCGTHWDFGVHKSTMTHHFRILRQAGLTRTVVAGRTHSIELRRDELDARFPGLIDALAATAGVSSPATAHGPAPRSG